MSEVLFYHLQFQPLEKVLPALLEKCLEREWKVVVQGGDAASLQALDEALWSYRPESFLPHGLAGGEDDARQPVLLTQQGDNPNDAQVRFLVHGAEPPELGPYVRAVFLFDGNNDTELAGARQHWKAVKAAGHEVTYWQQGDSGGWVRKA